MAQDDAYEGNEGAVSKTSRGDDPLVGTVVADKYHVRAMVARGGMGRIYRAEQVPLGRIVALKILTPRYATDNDPLIQKRFLREAATCARLTHPNTVTVFDYGHMRQNGEDIFFMVMEFVEGRTVSRALKEDGAFTPSRALRIGREICRSLKEAHRLGIVHRDLKPSNVMLTWGDEGENVKVLDFGIAKSMQADAQSENLTLEGNFLGSPRYMAPEQIRHAESDGRADIYALGIVLFEMIGGKVPFDGDSPVKTLMLHLTEPVPTLLAHCGVSVPPEIEAVISKCLAKDPALRYPDVDAVREALRNAAAALGDDTGEHTDDRSGHGRLPQVNANAATAPYSRSEISGTGAFPEASLATGAVRAPGMKWGLAIGAVALAVVLLLLIGVAVGSGQFATPAPAAVTVAPATPVEPVEAPPAPPPPEPVRATLTLDSVPTGAEIWEGNRMHGKTPLPLVLEGEATRTLVLKLKGYTDVEVVQAWSAVDVQQTVTLKKIPVAKPKPKPVKPKPTADDIRSER